MDLEDMLNYPWCHRCHKGTGLSDDDPIITVCVFTYIWDDEAYYYAYCQEHALEVDARDEAFKKEHTPMTRVRIALISKPEMNFTETTDLLEDCLNNAAFNATCTRIPEEGVVLVTIAPHLQEGLLEWCRVSTFSSRYIDSTRVEPEDKKSTSIRVRLAGDATPEQVEDTLSSLRQLLVKLWLISLNRLNDLQDYDLTDNPRFEREAELAGFSVEIVEEK